MLLVVVLTIVTFVAVISVDEAFMAGVVEDLTAAVEVEDFKAEDVFNFEELNAFVDVGTELEEVCTTAAFVETTVPALATSQNTAGVYTGIGNVVPYPATPHAGFVGAVYSAGGLVVVTVVVNVVKLTPATEVAAQYPVP